MWGLWAVFLVIISVGIFVDIVALGKQQVSHDSRISARIVWLWITIALLFGVLIYFVLGHDCALQFFAGYLVELSLSVDNLFVFMSIFSYFKIVGGAQQKALTYGILGAIFMRIFFIFAGITLLGKFDWLIYIFGAMLIFSAVGMLQNKGQQQKRKGFWEKISRGLRIAKSSDELAFFTKSNGKWYVTPLLACVIAIELSDIIFAVDSVPAVLSITRVPLIVFSSNIFAVIGLRSLYIYLIKLTEKFSLLKYGIAANLLFVGTKMMFSEIFHIPTAISISIIAGSLLVAIIASVVVASNNGKEPASRA